ncbi:MAG: ABC transporter substrate-binding protein [Alphaproteobacteria bacterium]|nr:ABC transporter substrate-binding protein [Alphaproteobacteria bacterium]
MLIACEQPSAVEYMSREPLHRAQRVVSLDYCADQYVLKLLDRDQILAVSPYADSTSSYMREAAKGIAQVRSLAEDVLVLKPDLIVRSYGGGQNAQIFFEKAGIPVVQLGYAGDIDGIRTVLREAAVGLNAVDRAETIISEMDQRLLVLKQSADDKTALYMTPGGVTSGPGSLIHEMLIAAGLSNFQQEPGWRALPLERLAYEQPDMIAAAFFDSKANNVDAWTAARHPIARKQMAELETVYLQGAWTACGGWFLVDAIEALAVVDKLETAP